MFYKALYIPGGTGVLPSTVCLLSAAMLKSADLSFKPNPGTNQSHHTPRKNNMEPKNHPIEKENHLPNHHLQVPC